MESYNLVFKKSVAKDLRHIPNKDILKRINLLLKNPRAEDCIKLSGKEKYRARQGVYRIVYEIQDFELIITIVKVAHRGTVYKSR